MTLAKKYLFLTIWIIQIGPRYHLVIVIIGIYNEIVKYTGGPPVVRSQLVRIPLVRIFKKLS